MEYPRVEPRVRRCLEAAGLTDVAEFYLNAHTCVFQHMYVNAQFAGYPVVVEIQDEIKLIRFWMHYPKRGTIVGMAIVMADGRVDAFMMASSGFNHAINPFTQRL